MTPESGIESSRQAELTLPDYRGGGLVNLMSSIATALGGTSPYPPAAALPPEALAGTGGKGEIGSRHDLMVENGDFNIVFDSISR